MNRGQAIDVRPRPATDGTFGPLLGYPWETFRVSLCCFDAFWCNDARVSIACTEMDVDIEHELDFDFLAARIARDFERHGICLLPRTVLEIKTEIGMHIGTLRYSHESAKLDWI